MQYNHFLRDGCILHLSFFGGEVFAGKYGQLKAFLQVISLHNKLIPFDLY